METLQACLRKPLKILHICDRVQRDIEKGQGRLHIRLHLFCLVKLKSWRTLFYLIDVFPVYYVR